MRIERNIGKMNVMIKQVKHYIITSFLLIILLSTKTQAQSCFARVSVSPRQGVVRQPFQVTISVYTSTWYTAPLQFQNLQIENAFILPYTRTTPSVSYIDKNRYSTLSFYYIVYPFVEGEVSIPSLQIVATTPLDGDYKGVPVEVSTKEQRIQVKSVPDLEGLEVWNVATNMELTEKWDKDLNNIKVGDVINRTIYQYASGTLPNFIKQQDVTEIEGVSIYASEPNFKERRTESSINGELTQRVAYLFEKEGSVTIPRQQVLWYNPETKKIHKRNLPERKIQVQANPDLAMLTSLKDSLDALNATADIKQEQKEPFPWKKVIIAMLLGLTLSYYTLKYLFKLIKWILARRNTYLLSEKYKLRCFYKVLFSRNRQASIKALYIWFDAYRMAQDINTPEISSLLNEKQQCDLANLLNEAHLKLTSSEVNFLKQIVKQLIKDRSQPCEKEMETLNP